MSELIQRDMFPLWTTGALPDLSGMRKYTLLIRDGLDPEPPKKSAKHEDRDKTPHLTLRTHDPATWAESILRVLGDAKPRTFNGLCVEIAGMTADICAGEVPEQALFPVDLIKPMVLAGCPAGGTVLDPFSGAGTTLLVAKELGRSAVGIELSPDYCAMAVDRLKQDVLPLGQAKHRKGGA